MTAINTNVGALMAADAETEISNRKEELFDKEIENFINGIMDKKHIDSTPVWF